MYISSTLFRWLLLASPTTYVLAADVDIASNNNAAVSKRASAPDILARGIALPVKSTTISFLSTLTQATTSSSSSATTQPTPQTPAKETPTSPSSHTISTPSSTFQLHRRAFHLPSSACHPGPVSLASSPRNLLFEAARLICAATNFGCEGENRREHREHTYPKRYEDVRTGCEGPFTRSLPTGGLEDWTRTGWNTGVGATGTGAEMETKTSTNGKAWGTGKPAACGAGGLGGAKPCPPMT